MKKVLLLVALGVILLNPQNPERKELTQLLPVKVMYAERNDGFCRILTDEGLQGTGKNMKDAIYNIEQAASGKLLYETAEFLLIPMGQEALIPETLSYLRPSCKVCLVKGKVELEDVAEYLKSHSYTTTIRKWVNGAEKMAVLTCKDGRMALAENG